MVPAAGISTGNASISALVKTDANIPQLKNLKKLTLPPMVKLNQVPIGSVLVGIIIGVVDSLSSRADMRESKLIHLKHVSGEEFLFPLTAQIKKAVGGIDGLTKNAGKMLVLKRLEDGETTKYGAPGDAPKKVYMFDVYIGDL
jgi:hypothetical protein